MNLIFVSPLPPNIETVMSIIEVNHVTKEYRLGHMKSLKQSVLGAIGRLHGRLTPKQKGMGQALSRKSQERTPFLLIMDADSSLWTENARKSLYLLKS